MLEALVAICILTAVGVSTMLFLGAAVKGTMLIRDKSCAIWVAQNQIAKQMLFPTGGYEGILNGEEYMCGRNWQWQIEKDKNVDPRFLYLHIRVFSHGRKKVDQEVIFPR